MARHFPTLVSRYTCHHSVITCHARRIRLGSCAGCQIARSFCEMCAAILYREDAFEGPLSRDQWVAAGQMWTLGRDDFGLIKPESD